MSDPGVIDVASTAQRIRAMYNHDAAAYARVRAPMLRAIGERLVAGLDVANARLVLDVGCGTGSLLGNGILGIDASAEMLARRPAGTHAVCGEATRLPFRDSCADGATCAFVLGHLPDPGAVVREMARVMRPGGRIAVATWGAEVQWQARLAIAEIFDEFGAPKVATSQVGASLVDSTAKLAALMETAGLRMAVEATVRITDLGLPPFTLDDAVDVFTAVGSAGGRLDALPPDSRAALRAAVRDRLAEFRPEQWHEPRDALLVWVKAT